MADPDTIERLACVIAKEMRQLAVLAYQTAGTDGLDTLERLAAQAVAGGRHELEVVSRG